MKKTAQQLQKPNPFVCQSFDCENLAVVENGFCQECKTRKTIEKRTGKVVPSDFADALKGSMKEANIISPSPTETETSSQIEQTGFDNNKQVVQTDEPTDLSASYMFG